MIENRVVGSLAVALDNLGDVGELKGRWAEWGAICSSARDAVCAFVSAGIRCADCDVDRAVGVFDLLDPWGVCDKPSDCERVPLCGDCVQSFCARERDCFIKCAGCESSDPAVGVFDVVASTTGEAEARELFERVPYCRDCLSIVEAGGADVELVKGGE